jgi:hypothetical protein
MDDIVGGVVVELNNKKRKGMKFKRSEKKKRTIKDSDLVGPGDEFQ